MGALALACGGGNGGGGADGTDGDSVGPGTADETGPMVPDIPPGIPCDWPAVACAGSCVDITSDGQHCGGCGLTCDAGRSCVDGTCRAPCATPSANGLLVERSAFGMEDGSQTSILLADADADGNLDALVRVNAALYAHLGIGDGTFGPALPTTSIGGTSAIFFATDVDGDDVPDVVGAGQFDVMLASGIGDGTFAEAVPLVEGSAKDVADADGDLGPDIVFATVDGPMSRIGILLNRGDGTFDPPQMSPVLGLVGSVATGDFDGDGVLDVAYEEDNAGRIGWMPGDGSGGLGEPRVVTVDTVLADRLEWMGIRFAVGRFTGASRDELVATTADSGQFARSEILLYRVGEGDALAEVVRYESESRVSWQRAVDLDDDGRPELVAFSWDAEVLRYDADAPPRAESFDVVTTDTANTGRPIGDFGDVDGNGSLDLVVPGPGVGFEDAVNVAAHLVHAPGAVSDVRVEFPAGAEGVAAADLDGDGFVDLVGGVPRTAVVWGGANGLSAPQLLGETEAMSTPAIGDLDADGDLDVVVADEQVIVLRNEGARTFSSETHEVESSQGVAIADANGDGNADIVSNSRVLLGPDFTFELPLSLGRVEFAVGDLDGDGLVDFLGSDGAVHNLGDGAFEPWHEYPNEALSSVAVGDLDGDGVLDFVGRDGSFVRAGRGLGDGSFVDLSGGGSVDDFIKPAPWVGDWDGDGRDEVFVIRDAYDDVITSVEILGLQGDALVSRAIIPMSADARTVSAADVDGDGILDVLATYSVGDGDPPSVAVAPTRCD